jgi:tetratricopeptide (TPR) repeat protein
MEQMSKVMHPDALADLELEELFRLGTEALDMKDYATACRYLQAAVERDRSPNNLSQYALALAAHTRNIEPSIALCQEAVKREPKNSDHFLRLGTIYLVAGRKKEAIRIFKLGLRIGKNPTISRWLQVLGRRKDPVLPFLSRNNPVNKYLGKLRSTITGR